MRFYVIRDIGSREYMEDRHTASKVGNSSHVAAVFDGHSGYELSQYCAANFAKHLSDALEMRANDTVMAIKESVDRLDKVAKEEMPTVSAGTTLCAVLVQPTSIVTANVGDSRAILFTREDGGTTYELSKDHKPSVKSEEDRILRSGGFVTQPQFGDGAHRVMGKLSLSRALGDWEMRPWVIAASDVTVHKRTPHDDFVVIATDGVWDVMSSGEVAASLRTAFDRGTKPHAAMRGVLSECRRRGSGDNVTIIVVEVGRKPLVPTLL